jgi:subfamily B ATP-binding cassette protein MsbA
MNQPRHATELPTEVLIRRLAGRYLRPYAGRLAAAMAMMIISAGLTAGFAKLIQPLLDHVLVQHRGDLIAPMGVAIFAVFFCNGIATYAYTVMMARIGQGIVADIQSDLFNRFVTLDLSFFQRNPSGQLAARITSDVNVVRAAITECLVGIGKNFLTLIFLASLMFMQDRQLSIISICIIPTAGIAGRLLGRRLRRISNRIQSEIGVLTSSFTQIFQGIRQVKAYGMEEFEKERSGRVIRAVRKQFYKSNVVSTLSTPVNEALIGLALMGLVIYGGGKVVHDEMTLGQLMSFIAAFSLSYEPIRRMAKLTNTLQTGLGAGERILEMLDIEPEIVDRAGAVAFDPARGTAIAFENVSFSYEAEGEGAQALDGLSFTAPGASVTALVGPSGSGKSTVLNMVLRFFEPQAGIVSIGGNDIRDLTIASLRRNIALVSQDITIFDDSVRANIAYGRLDATEEEIYAAARAAAADDFIRALPEGYDTRLGEHGLKLSGGQRQRIAIARAILRDAPILLLDEATSALDNESERAIQQSLGALQEGRTVLVIAHRLSTVQHADQIIVLDRGRVAEQGRHDELMAKDGVYARMYRAGLKE